jgi:hypothetical protein
VLEGRGAVAPDTALGSRHAKKGSDAYREAELGRGRVRTPPARMMLAAGHLPPSYAAGAAFLMPLIGIAAAWWAFASDRKRPRP